MLQSETVKKYDTYKDSGIEWIGEIPQEWQIGNLKRLTNFIKNGTSATQIDNETSFKVSRIETISKGEIDYSKVGYIEEFDNIADYKLTKGDILFSNINSLEMVGNIAIFENEETLYSGMNLLRISVNSKTFPKWLFYVLKNSYFVEQVKANAKHAINQVSIGVGRLSQIPIAIPKFEEQQRIADYLDNKCGEIDRVVETEKAVIEKLKEYKQYIITDAVTKGLDKSVPLKDSGIEWIGKIPQHWEMLKLKYIAECNREVLSENTKPDKCIDYIEIGSVTNESGINGYETLTFENAPSRARRIVNNGDTIISTVRTYLKAIAYIDDKYDKFICSTGFAVFTPNKKVLPKFLFHALHSEWFVSTVEANSVGISYPAINTTNIVNYKIAIPSVKEQEQILKYLDKKCSEIDKAIADKEQVIEKFTEYKKSLIYECVTGKRKVC